MEVLGGDFDDKAGEGEEGIDDRGEGAGAWDS